VSLSGPNGIAAYVATVPGLADALEALRSVRWPHEMVRERLDEPLRRAEDFGISRDEVLARLQPSREVLSRLHEATELACLEDIKRKLRVPSPLHEELRRRRDYLRPRVEALGLGKRRYPIPPPEFFNRPFREIRDEHTITLTGFFRDHAMDLYRWIADQIPSRRQQHRRPRDPRDVKYNLDALCLTADLLSAAYAPYLHSDLTFKQLKQRVARRNSRVTPKGSNGT
jgi:hypothetical protein